MKEQLVTEFGEEITRLTEASTKNRTISDKVEQTNELIQRCAGNGESALIVKTADILDSFNWYTKQNNEDELRYCIRNAEAILRYKPSSFNDKIFTQLETTYKEHSHLVETGA